VVAPHDDRDPAGACAGRDLVGAARGVGLDGEREEVGLEIVRHRLDPLVEQLAVDVLWCERGEDGEDERLHRVEGARTGDAWTDERDLHTPRPMSGSIRSIQERSHPHCDSFLAVSG
jgi:hypothetical protein